MGVYLQNSSYLSCYLSYTTKLNTKLKLRHTPIIPIAYANDLIYIFINIHENIKNVIHRWGYMLNFNNISAALSHRLLKFVLKKAKT